MPTIRTYRRDLERAGIAYTDEQDRVADFHALRHTFVTNLVNAGMMPKDTKQLARHSTITLTMDRYAHVGIRDTAAASFSSLALLNAASSCS